MGATTLRLSDGREYPDTFRDALDGVADHAETADPDLAHGVVLFGGTWRCPAVMGRAAADLTH